MFHGGYMTKNTKEAFVKKLATEVAGLAIHATDPDTALMSSKFIDEVWQAYSKHKSSTD